MKLIVYICNCKLHVYLFVILVKLKAVPNILSDDRFKVMFENPDYQVDEQSEEFRLLNPIVSKVGLKNKKKLRLLAQQAASLQKVMQYQLCRWILLSVCVYSQLGFNWEAIVF